MAKAQRVHLHVQARSSEESAPAPAPSSSSGPPPLPGWFAPGGPGALRCRTLRAIATARLAPPVNLHSLHPGAAVARAQPHEHQHALALSFAVC